MTMIKPMATVILPTFNHGSTLRLAIESALGQTVPVEVFIIGDGVPERNKLLIQEIVSGDSRVKFFDYPKHVSRGEPYRDHALKFAKGEIVCYLCDRDLWFPEHVERLAVLLKKADFAHSFPFHILPGNEFKSFPVDLRVPFFRQLMLKKFNRVPFSSAAHTLDFYHQLNNGWDTTPSGQATDWHFFKKFLSKDNCRCVSGTDPTVLTFPSPPRLTWTEEQRVEELTLWRTRIGTADRRKELVLTILKTGIIERDMYLGNAYAKLYPEYLP
jgi:glycosyltransferase involved in cell wall biosynthesis